MVKMTDISFISHNPEPLKGSKSVRDECKQNCLPKSVIEFTYLSITIRIGVRLLPPIAAPTNTTTRKIISCLLQPFALQLVTETDETFDDMDEMH